MGQAAPCAFFEEQKINRTMTSKTFRCPLRLKWLPFDSVPRGCEREQIILRQFTFGDSSPGFAVRTTKEAVASLKYSG